MDYIPVILTVIICINIRFVLKRIESNIDFLKDQIMTLRRHDEKYEREKNV